MLLPFKFNVDVDSDSGSQTNWNSRANNFEIKTSIPTEFDGPNNGVSPEDLFALALTNCFLATFKVIAEKSKLTYSNISIHSTLEVDKNDSSGLIMKHIHFNVSLTGSENIDRSKRLLEKTVPLCMILNSVITSKSFEFHVS